jgi:hypothetical protein
VEGAAPLEEGVVGDDAAEDGAGEGDTSDVSEAADVEEDVL